MTLAVHNEMPTTAYRKYEIIIRYIKETNSLEYVERFYYHKDFKGVKKND